MVESLLQLLTELVCQFIAEAFLTGVDAVFWSKSRANRRLRKSARRAGTPLPRRHVWTWLFILLSPVVLLFGVMLLLAIFRRLG